MGARVFLSYAWADRLATPAPGERAHRTGVLTLADALTAAGLEVFLDDRSIEMWDSISARIRTRLAASAVMVSWCSPAYLRSAPARPSSPPRC